jgi:hypothetical protein
MTSPQTKHPVKTRPAVHGEITARACHAWTPVTRPYISEIEAMSLGEMTHTSAPQVPVAIIMEIYVEANTDQIILSGRCHALSRDKKSASRESRLNFTSLIQAPKSWKSLFSLLLTCLSEDPIFKKLSVETIPACQGLDEMWQAFCIPEGVIYIRKSSKLVNACEDQDDFQRILDENVRVVATPTASAHAILHQARLLQDLLELLIVKKSFDTTGHDPDARFTRPNISIRIS